MLEIVILLGFAAICLGVWLIIPQIKETIDLFKDEKK